VRVREEAVLVTPFATLVHFAKATDVPQPRVLVVAPLSGHFATLLRGTIRTLLRGHDVFVTDWHNARDIGLRHGRFGADEYVEHLMDFLTAIGPGTHLVAVCQPCVPALAAAALMAEDGDPACPRSLTLMAGPIDARMNPTRVHLLACGRPLEWFERNVLLPVRSGTPGGCAWSPGFLQLAAFMNMNRDRHYDALRGLYRDIAEGNDERAAKTKAFYDEYFSVLDLPAEFYLDTVRSIFQEHDLARGVLRWRGRPVDPRSVRSPLLTVEGEHDDICSVGQTAAAHELCTGIPPAARRHHLQPGVGHYGVFSGRRWSSRSSP
jgi:poly(3-hydroxybutyrate) depolymerase